MIWRVPLFGFERPAILLATTAVVSVHAGYSARNLRLDVSASALSAVPAATSPFPPEGDEVVVVARSSSIATAEGVRALRALHDDLAAIPSVNSVDDAFTVRIPLDVEGAFSVAPVLDPLPADAAAVAAAWSALRADPASRGRLVSDDGGALAMAVSVEEGDGDVAAAIRAVLDRHRARFDALTAVGGPQLRAELERRIARDSRTTIPLAALALFVVLAGMLRSATLAAIPVLLGGVATLWTAGAMASLGIPVNPLNATLPVLVLIVGGIADVHLTHEFRSRVAAHGFDRLALFEVAERVGPAVALNHASTILGFAATAMSALPVLRQFGAAAAIGLTFRFALTFAALPALLRFALPAARASRARSGERPFGTRVAAFAVDHLGRRSRLLILGCVAILVLAVALLPRLKRENDLLAFLGEGDPFVEELRAAERGFAGFQTIEVVVGAPLGTFARASAVAALDAAAERAAGVAGTGSAVGLGDALRSFRAAWLGASEPGRWVPADDRAVAQSLLLAGSRSVASWVTADRSSARILVATGVREAERLLDLREGLRLAAASTIPAAWSVTITGAPLDAAEAADAITRGQVASLGSMVVVLFLVISGVFLSLRSGLLAVLVNVVAVGGLFAGMAAFGIPLNVGTCLVASVTLGIVVDDTVHLLFRYNREVRVHREERAAMRAASSEEAAPMLIAAAGLAGGFAILGLSAFEPVRQFGLLSAAVIAGAVLVDLFLSPALFARARVVTLWDLLGLGLRGVLLEQSRAFAGLSRWQARKLVLASDEARFQAGEVLIRQGAVDRSMYVLLEGEVDAVDLRGQERQVLARLGAGDLVGEMAFLSGRPRKLEVVAREPVRALVVTRESLESLRRFSPYLVSRLLLNIAALVAERNEQDPDPAVDGVSPRPPTP